MSDSSTGKDTDIALVILFLFIFLIVFFKYVPQVVTYPWAAFMYVETYYIKSALEYLPKTPFHNAIDAAVFVMFGVLLKSFIFTEQLAKKIIKAIDIKPVKEVLEGNILFHLYFVLVSTTAVLVFNNTDGFYYDVAAVWERLHYSSWKSLTYTNVAKVDYYFIMFNAAIVVPANLYMASKFVVNPKNKIRHDLDSLIRNLSTYFGFNRYLIARNPLIGKSIIDLQTSHHAITYKSNAYLTETGVLSSVQDKTGELQCTFIDSRKLFQVLSYQMGPVFTTFENMEEKHRWLAVCFALIVAGKRDRAESINYKIGYYYNNKELPPENLSKIKSAIRKFKYSISKNIVADEINELVNKAIAELKAHKEVSAICAQHGFVYTLIARLQYESGRKGKTPPNHYYWIYFEDRILGMVVCDQGKPGYSMECYAPKCVADNERISKKPMRMPDVGGVIKKLEQFLISEFPVYMYQPETTAKIISEQESFKLVESGALPEFGYWTLRHIKSLNEMPDFAKKGKLKYPVNWSEEMKRYAVVADIPDLEAKS